MKDTTKREHPQGCDPCKNALIPRVGIKSTEACLLRLQRPCCIFNIVGFPKKKRGTAKGQNPVKYLFLDLPAYPYGLAAMGRTVALVNREEPLG